MYTNRKRKNLDVRVFVSSLTLSIYFVVLVGWLDVLLRSCSALLSALLLSLCLVDRFVHPCGGCVIGDVVIISLCWVLFAPCDLHRLRSCILFVVVTPRDWTGLVSTRRDSLSNLARPRVDIGQLGASSYLGFSVVYGKHVDCDLTLV